MDCSNCEDDVANLILTPEELRPLVRGIVEQTLGELEEAKSLLNGKLAVSEAEAAALLSLNTWQLRDLRLAGKINHSRIVGGRIRYTSADLIEYLQRNRDAGNCTGR